MNSSLPGLTIQTRIAHIACTALLLRDLFQRTASINFCMCALRLVTQGKARAKFGIPIHLPPFAPPSERSKRIR